jgi:sugar phosphate permease
VLGWGKGEASSILGLSFHVLAGVDQLRHRIVLSVSSTPITEEFGISKVELGYLLSSFLWLYFVCLVPMGIIVDRKGTRLVNAAGIGV